MSYESEIRGIARQYVNREVGYKSGLNLARHVALKHDRDPGWSSVDFETEINNVLRDMNQKDAA